MALFLKDRVQELASANTTVSFSLNGYVQGYRSFGSALADGDSTYYGATDGNNWEIGVGTYVASTNRLTRQQILSSSNSDLAVTFSGVVTVFIDYPASKAVYQGGKFSLDHTWIDYVTDWSTTPLYLVTIADGEVWKYTYAGGAILYRLVPSGATQDSFYTTFTGGVLSELVVSRGMTP